MFVVKIPLFVHVFLIPDASQCLTKLKNKCQRLKEQLIADSWT